MFKLLASGALTGALGCSVFYDLDRTTRGEASSPDGGGAPDAGGTSDGAPDTGVSEGGPVTPGAFCEGQTGANIILCDDFDKNTFDPRWTKKELALPRGELAPGGYSPPDAFHLVVEPKPGRPSPDRLALVVDTAGAVRGLTAAFRVKPVKFPSSTSSSFRAATIEQVPGDPTRDLSLILAEASPLTLEEQIDPPEEDAKFRTGTGSMSPAIGAWTQIEIDVDFEPSPPRAEVRVDGTVALDFSLTPGWSVGKTRFLLGNFYIKDTTGFEVFYDDVVVRTR